MAHSPQGLGRGWLIGAELPYFHMGSTLLFPLPVFSLCQPGGAQGSPRSEEHPARDLFGARLHLGCSGNTLPLSLERNGCPPAEGVVAPVVPGISLARPAVTSDPGLLLELCTAHGCEFGPHRWPGGCCHCHKRRAALSPSISASPRWGCTSRKGMDLELITGVRQHLSHLPFLGCRCRAL